MATTAKFIGPVVMHHTEGHKIPRIGMEHFVVLFDFVRKAMLRANQEVQSQPQALGKL